MIRWESESILVLRLAQYLPSTHIDLRWFDTVFQKSTCNLFGTKLTDSVKN